MATHAISLRGNIFDDAPDFVDWAMEDKWTDVAIDIENNAGGYIQGTLGYIKNIRSTTHTTFTVGASGFIASAASVLYFYLLLNQRDRKLRNVACRPPREQIQVMFHRLRSSDTNRVIDSSGEEKYDLDSCMRPCQTAQFVDDVFEATVEFLEYIDECHERVPLLSEARQTYYSGADYVFTYKGEYACTVDAYLRRRNTSA